MYALDSIKDYKLTGNKNYDNHISVFLKDLNGRPVNMDTILDFFNKAKQKYAYRTIAVKRAAIKAFLLNNLPDADSIKFKIMLDQAFKDIKIPKPDNSISQEKILTEYEISKLIAQSPTRLSLIIETLYFSALRVSELLSIRLRDLTFQKEKVEISILGKRSKIRTIFIPLELYQHIRKEFKGEKYLFSNKQGLPISRQYVWRAVNTTALNLLNKPLHPHLLRHSRSSHLLKQGISLKALSHFLGHASSSITSDFYIHDSLSYEDLLYAKRN